MKLARAHRDGALTPVWVPDEPHGEIRDLTRSRESARDASGLQQMPVFLDRYGWRYTLTKSNWTKRQYRWLDDLKFENPQVLRGFQLITAMTIAPSWAIFGASPIRASS